MSAITTPLFKYLRDISSSLLSNGGFAFYDKDNKQLISKDNIGNDDLSFGIDATKIADGSVSNTIFQYLKNIVSDVQSQFNDKADLVDGLIPASQLPSYVDDVIEYDSFSLFPPIAETGKIYIDKSTNEQFRWSGSVYVSMKDGVVLGETSATAYRGDRGKTAYDHSNIVSGNPHNVTKTDIGLGNVDNTSNSTEREASATLKNKNLSDSSNTFPTFNQNTTGNASTATKLLTARNINNVTFDGSEDIILDPVTTIDLTSVSSPLLLTQLQAVSKTLIFNGSPNSPIDIYSAYSGDWTVINESDKNIRFKPNLNSPIICSVQSGFMRKIVTDTINLWAESASQKINFSDGMIGLWLFDELSGTSVTNLISENPNITIVNTPTWISYPTSLRFNYPTQSQEVMNINSTSSLGSLDGITVYMRVLVHGIVSSYKNLFLYSNGSGALYFRPWQDSGSAIKYFDSGVNHTITGPSNSVLNGVWTDLVTTYDNTTGSAVLYINGNIYAGGTFNTGITGGSSGSFEFFSNGNDPHNDNDDLQADIDVIAIWNKAIPSSEIQNLTNIGLDN